MLIKSLIHYSYITIPFFIINTNCIFGTNEKKLETSNINDSTIKKFTPFTFTTEELIGKGEPNLVGNGYKLLPEVSKQFESMKVAAAKEGFNIYVVSSYRNFNYQNSIWKRKYKSNKAKNIPSQQNINKIIEYSTIPGTSRHHWGTDLDIIDATKGIPSDPLNEKHFNIGGSMHQFKLWLDHNASKYGFYLAYTNNPSRKGFKYEPWHFSYKLISKPMLDAYKKLDIKEVLKENRIMGSESFSDEFIDKYKRENILDINPELK